MKRNTVAARAALLAAAALAIAGCDMISSSEAEKGIAAGAGAEAAGAGAGAAAPAAPASTLDPLLASPAVGDIWAADLNHFSAASFNTGEGGTAGDAFGLVRVVNVTDTQVTIITEMGAYPELAGALSDLAGDMASITWDESERIPINRADFAQLVADQRILRTRRGAGGAAAGGGANSGDYSAGGGNTAAPAAPAAPAPAAPGGSK
jgi:hypothetical protein